MKKQPATVVAIPVVNPSKLLRAPPVPAPIDPPSDGVRSQYKTIPEAAAYLHCAEWAIGQANRAGDLKYVKLGKRFVMTTQELDAYFQRKMDAA